MHPTLLVVCVLLFLGLLVDASELRHTRFGFEPSLARSGPRVQWYSRSEAPQGWTKLHAAELDEQVRFTVVLTGSNADELERRFWAVSDPQSSSYGQWMSAEAISQLVAPSPAEWRQVQSSLTAHGLALEQVVSHGDSFDVVCSVEQASALFATRFFHFQHAATGVEAIRQWGAYSLPAALAAQTELVLNIHTFPTSEQRTQMRAVRDERRKQRSSAPTAPAWVPKAVSAIYGVPYPIEPLAYQEVNAGVIEWVEQTFNQTDLDFFSQQVRTPVRDPASYHIVGNNSEAPAGVEASLDIQWIEGINPGSTISDPSDWMYTFTVQFLTATDYPSIISLSYGLPELMQCTAFDPSDCNGLSYQQYIKIVDKQFMKIGLLGVSVIVCSQDRGTYVSEGEVTPFMPEYPGTSPYITSVGATEMGNPQFNLTDPPPACSAGPWQCVSGGDEQAVSGAISGYLSGGGFSSVDVRPAYQSAAVEAYFTSGVSLPDASAWNRTGRGFPDVSAIGYNGYIVDSGAEYLVSGTSMSTPIVAAIVALVAHDFYKMTNMTLGFLNPLLYQAQAAGAGIFTDITVGDNCATQRCEGSQDGFKCAKGWDPVTGLGSPVYPAMQRYVMAHAEHVVARRNK